MIRPNPSDYQSRQHPLFDWERLSQYLSDLHKYCDNLEKALEIKNNKENILPTIIDIDSEPCKIAGVNKVYWEVRYSVLEDDAKRNCRFDQFVNAENWIEKIKKLIPVTTEGI